MSRLGPIPREDMTEAQGKVFDGISGGARGGDDPSVFLNEEGALRGPFNAMLRSPEMGDLIQQTGAAIRYASVIPGALRELAILTCGRHWEANYEWHAHAKIALKEGVSQDVLDAMLAGEVPSDPDQALVVTFIDELQNNKRVSDATYRKAMDLLGERGVTELVFLAGYYALISHVLNAFEVPVPKGEQPPFPNGAGA